MISRRFPVTSRMLLLAATLPWRFAQSAQQLAKEAEDVGKRPSWFPGVAVSKSKAPRLQNLVGGAATLVQAAPRGL